MSMQPAFWNSSALIPLCMHESTSRLAHAQLLKFLPLVWWASLVEVHSAIARLHRGGQMTDAEEQKALSQLDLLDRGWREILPGNHVREMATPARIFPSPEMRYMSGGQPADEFLARWMDWACNTPWVS